MTRRTAFAIGLGGGALICAAWWVALAIALEGIN